jgi:methylmalonyl-CoA mutase C-terminal domain/subunit
MDEKKRIRVLIAKPGLDGHDRGAKVITYALRQKGMEVIYTGLRQSCEEIVASAIQEDVDVIGLSILSGAHMGIVGKLMAEMKKQSVTDIPVVLGGVVPNKDSEELRGLGIRGVFRAGTPLQEIVAFITNCAREKMEAEKR